MSRPADSTSEPTAALPWRVFQDPEQNADELRFVVARAPMPEGASWAWWWTWAVAAFSVRAIAEAFALLLAGKLPATPAADRRFGVGPRRERPAVLDHGQAAMPIEQQLEWLGCPPMHELRAEGLGWVIGEMIAGGGTPGHEWAYQLLARLGSDHYAAAMDTVRELREHHHADNLRFIGEHPLAQAALETLERFAAEHPDVALERNNVIDQMDAAAATYFGKIERGRALVADLAAGGEGR